MKKILTPIFLTAAVCLQMNAQTTIKGILVDSISHEAEPYATVRVYKNQNYKKPVSVGVTDVDGNIKNTIEKSGTYIIKISALGRKDITRTVRADGKSDVNLGTLLLVDDHQTLEGVTITAQKPLVKMEVDKMTYDIASDADSKSSTVLEMLRKVPMVAVDGQDNITLNGSSSFKVYMNGKPNEMMTKNASQIFKSMPSSGIKNIEVTTQPGAKYDAEGVGGILNIITDNSKGKGNDLESKTLTVRARMANTDYGGGVFSAMQQGKLSMSLNFATNRTHTKQNVTTDTEREQISGDHISTMTSHTDSKTGRNFNMADFNAGYEIDSLRLVSANFGIWKFESNGDNNTLSTFTQSVAGTPFSYKTTGFSKSKSISFNGGIDYQRSFRNVKDRLLTFSYRISSSPMKTKNLSQMSSNDDQQWLDINSRYNDVDNNTIENTFQIDYTTPVNEKLTIESGIKYINRNNKSISDDYNVSNDNEYTLNDDACINYRHLNDILAGYAQAAYKMSKTSVKAGLRYEHTWQNVEYKKGHGEDFKLDYGNLVPSANFSYTISQSLNAGITYSMRIQRPGINMLNPFVSRHDPTSISYGNTNLDAETSHEIGGVLNYFTTKLMMNITANYTICDNALSSYSFYDSNGIMNTTFGNVAKNKTAGLSSYINWSITPATRFTMNMRSGYQDMRSEVLGLSNHGFFAHAFIGLQQKFGSDMRFALNTILESKRPNLTGNSDGIAGGFFTIGKAFMKKKLDVSIYAGMPFTGTKLKSTSRTFTNDINAISVTRTPMAHVMLNVGYTIGGKVNVKKTKRSITNDDVQQPDNGQNSMGGSGM